MAKTPPAAPDQDAAAQTPGAPATPVPTPDNTPLPGGGSWKWDDALPGWAPN